MACLLLFGLFSREHRGDELIPVSGDLLPRFSKGFRV